MEARYDIAALRKHLGYVKYQLTIAKKEETNRCRANLKAIRKRLEAMKAIEVEEEQEAIQEKGR